MKFFDGSLVADVSLSPAAPPGTAIGLSGNNANMLYIFNRSGVCLLYREWYGPHRTLDAKEDQKLMFGLLFSLRSFTAKMDPTRDKGNLGAPLWIKFLGSESFLRMKEAAASTLDAAAGCVQDIGISV